jgi:hypothetical protein
MGEVYRARDTGLGRDVAINPTRPGGMRSIYATFVPRCAVTADGQRFLVITSGDEEEPESAPATVVRNWTAGIKP